LWDMAWIMQSATATCASLELSPRTFTPKGWL